MVTVRCNECGFDCEFTTTGNIEKVIFDYWGHMNNEHEIVIHHQNNSGNTESCFIENEPSG